MTGLELDSYVLVLKYVDHAPYKCHVPQTTPPSLLVLQEGRRQHGKIMETIHFNPPYNYHYSLEVTINRY